MSTDLSLCAEIGGVARSEMDSRVPDGCLPDAMLLYLVKQDKKIRHEVDLVDAQCDQHLRRDAVVALVRLPAEHTIGLERVDVLVLEKIRIQLVVEPDPAAFLTQIQQDAATGGQGVHRLVQLRPAVAARGAEQVSGKALAVQPDQGRLGRRGKDTRQVLPPVRETPEGHQLRGTGSSSHQSDRNPCADTGLLSPHHAPVPWCRPISSATDRRATTFTARSCRRTIVTWPSQAATAAVTGSIRHRCETA